MWQAEGSLGGIQYRHWYYQRAAHRPSLHPVATLLPLQLMAGRSVRKWRLRRDRKGGLPSVLVRSRRPVVAQTDRQPERRDDVAPRRLMRVFAGATTRH